MPKVVGRFLGFVCGIIFSLVITTTADAQPTSPGIYFPPSAWDLKIPSTARFLVLSNFANQAVLDIETGLVWERAPGDTNGDGAVTVADRLTPIIAKFHCATKSVGGRKGWRLPWLSEIASLLESDGTGPFLNVQNTPYWSATLTAESSTFGWAVVINTGGVLQENVATSDFVWCVRGPTSMDRY